MSRTDNFWVRYDKWQQSAIESFLEDYPGYEEYPVEVTEQGDVYVHAGGAYPLIFRGAVLAWEGLSNPNKSFRQFIRENRNELDEMIRRALDRPEYRLNDEERRQWVLNDEGLYLWARSEGVRI